MSAWFLLALLMPVAEAQSPAAKPAAPATPPAAAPAPPYRLLVCLRAADRPILTPLFVSTVARQVRDQTVNYFGALAEVDVRTSGHWLLDDFPHQGVDAPALTPASLAAHGIQGTVFLAGLDYRDGFYEVSWRQADASTGQAGPLRRRRTTDRQWVSKAICLAIRSDFPVLADVRPDPSNEFVHLTLRGEGHGTRLGELVGQRCVLRPYWVLRLRQGLERRPVPNTLLYIDRERGTDTARVATNLSEPWPRRAVIAGFEAVKLSTQTGRLRIRLLDAESRLPVPDCSVSANDRGYESLSEADLLERPDREGWVLAAREFRQIAFVKVSHGDAVVRMPVPITEDLCEQVILIHADQDAGEKEDFRRSLRFLVQDLQSIQTMRAAAIREFNELNSQKKYEEGLARVRAALEFIEGRLQNARSSLVALQERAGRRDEGSRALVQAAARQINEADDGVSALRRTRDDVETAITKRDAQARANVIIGVAQQQEQDGDIDEAILRYELALSEQPDQPALREKVDQLRKTWQVKGPDHEQARTLIYQRWAKAEVTEIESLLPQVQKALDTLRARGDPLSARRLSIVNNSHLGQLNAVIDQLSLRSAEEDKAELEKYAALTEKLAAFQTRVVDYLEQALTESPPAAPAETTPQPPSTPLGPDAAPPGKPAAEPPKGGTAVPPEKPPAAEPDENPAVKTGTSQPADSPSAVAPPPPAKSDEVEEEPIR
ncbi:MAG: hypothetical protein GXY58_07865 [Planctomycetaceae bacterium]|nr:hypothetical protein [Planctomycetaceae bacterium]